VVRVVIHVCFGGFPGLICIKFLGKLDPGDTWTRLEGKIGVPGEHGDAGEAQQLCRPHDRGEFLRIALVAHGKTFN
jgi:hypothetical protein